MPRRVSFGNTPVPIRPANSRTSSKSFSPKILEHHRTLHGNSVSMSPANTTLEQLVPAQKIKSMSDLDKEEEARMAKSHKAKAMKGVSGVLNWLGKKIKGNGVKKV